MKYYVILSVVIGYLYLTVSGTTDETFNNATHVETSFTNTTIAEESSSNGTKLQELSKNATDLKVPLQDTSPYLIQNETEPILEHGFRSKITGGFNRIKNIGTNVKNRIKGIGNNVKNRIKGIGTSGGGSSGGGGSSNYHYRYRPTTGTSSPLGTSTILYIVFGVIGGIILVSVLCYIVGK